MAYHITDDVPGLIRRMAPACRHLLDSGFQQPATIPESAKLFMSGSGGGGSAAPVGKAPAGHDGDEDDSLHRGLRIKGRSMSGSADPKVILQNIAGTPAWLTRFAAELRVLIVRSSRKLARHEVLAAIVAGLLPITVRLALLPFAPIPVPFVHDEFSNLLAADTFSHGRLTNPPHPFWQHFESFHILQQPTYMSMYPPGQAVFLALGQTLFGHPWFGLCVVFVLLGMASYWALRAWLPPAWALPGALVVSANFGVAEYWMNSYYGGATAALGGFLVIGSAGRLLIRPDGQRLRNALLLGLGILILANTRPWEGLVFCTGVAVFGGARYFIRHPPQSASMVRRWWAVLVLVLSVGGALMGYYCWRVTGNALQFPYLLNRRTYATVALFPWQKPRPSPHYNHEEMRRFYVEWEPSYQSDSKPFQLNTFTTRLFYLERATIFPPIKVFRAVAFLLVLWTGWLNRKTRWLVFVCGFFYVGICCQNYCQFHYVAPFVGVGAVLYVTTVRRWSLASRAFRRVGGPSGVGALYLLALSLLFVNSVRLIAEVPKPNANFALRRESLIQKFRKMPGRQLVIVRYSPEHVLDQEWVYNDADIDGAQVVWARDMGPARNDALRAYFRNRHAWLLEPEKSQVRLVPIADFPRASQ